MVGATFIACLFMLAGGTVFLAPRAGAQSPNSTATAPQQLVHAYPLGPQRLCCTAGTRARPAGTVRRAQESSAAQAAGRTRQTGSSNVIWIVVVSLGALVLVAAAAIYRTRRQPTLVAGQGSVPRIGVETASRERAYRDGDEAGEAGAAFNLGVLLQGRGDFAGALAAYQRAEGRGDPDAAFNLGVLLYDTGDIDGAEAAWRRSLQRGHLRAAANLRYLAARHHDPDALQTASVESTESAYRDGDEAGEAGAAFNLGVLLQGRGDFAGALAAYQRAEGRGDPDAAFNLGVLLYDTGDIDGAEAAWRRSLQRGHLRAAANLRYLDGRDRDLDQARDATPLMADPTHRQ